jgi:hypothetical protein
MYKLIFILTILMLSVSGCVQVNGFHKTRYDLTGIDKIAIVAVTGQIEHEGAQTQIAELFIMELLDRGYTPIPLSQSHSKIQSILDVEPIILPADGYAQMGQLLKVPAVLVINVPYLDEEISISAQLIDSEDGGVLWMGQDFGETRSRGRGSQFSNGRTQEDYLMDPLLMFREPPTTEPEIMTVKPGDRPLNPQELQKAKIVVENICSSLPSVKIYEPAHIGTTETFTGTRTKTKTRETIDW